MLDLELGNESIIPKQLQQQNLSPSYRFYDPVIRIIREKTTQDMKDYYALTYDLNVMKIEKYGYFTNKAMKLIGLDQNKIKKLLNYRYPTAHNDNIFDHYQTIEGAGIQKSKYIIIENDL